MIMRMSVIGAVLNFERADIVNRIESRDGNDRDEPIGISRRSPSNVRPSS
jgi:hypothetical protein